MRLHGKYPARAALVVLIGIAVFGAYAADAKAYSGPTYPVMNTSETPPDGVWFRRSPHSADTDRVTGHGVYVNERVQLVCYVWGDAVGAYANTLWYFVLNVSRPVNAGVENSGYLNAHYINDGTVANQIVAGVPACGATPQPPPQPTVTPCVYSMRWGTTALSVSYSGNHRYYGNAWQAAKNWSDLGTGISLLMLPESGGLSGQIIFDDVNSTNRSHQWYAQTGVPSAWFGPFTTIPVALNYPSTVHIQVNRAYMSKLDDPHKTYALTHELGHALGLAHSDLCGITSPSVMKSGGPDVPTRTVLTPQYYDRIELEMLYGLPLR